MVKILLFESLFWVVVARCGQIRGFSKKDKSVENGITVSLKWTILA